MMKDTRFTMKETIIDVLLALTCIPFGWAALIVFSAWCEG